jgi:hypothetical protein
MIRPFASYPLSKPDPAFHLNGGLPKEFSR